MFVFSAEIECYCRIVRQIKLRFDSFCDRIIFLETKKFQATTSLLLQYDSRLNYDTAFQEKFRLQVKSEGLTLVS